MQENELKFGEMFKKAIEYEYTREGNAIKERIGETENVYESFLNSLDKNLKYIFLTRNTFENRIVCQALENDTVYSVGVFKQDHSFSIENDSGIPYPTEHTFSSFDELKTYVHDSGFEKTAGIVIFGENNKQWKLLNHEYQKLFDARGNEPSIKFRYLQVRRDSEKTNMLYFLYPKYADIFDEYENALYQVAQTINSNYIKRFIKKKYVTVPKEEYKVMEAAHKWHQENRERNRISINKIIEILNEQPPTNLNTIVRKFNNEKNAKGENTKRPRAKSDDNIQDPTINTTINVLPTPPPSPPARQPIEPSNMDTTE